MDGETTSEPADSVSYVAVDGVVTTIPIGLRPLAADEVCVAVSCVSLGSFGWPTLPATVKLGDAFVGRVVDVGTDIDTRRVGQRVLGIQRAGAAATHLVMNATTVYPCHDDLAGEVVTAVATSGMVAWSLMQLVSPDHRTVVVNGAGNGITTILAGMLRQSGVTTIAVREFDTGRHDLEAAGFDAVITPSDGTPASNIDRLTSGRGADLVIECARPIAPWAHINSLLATHGTALTWAAGPDWDPQRSTTFAVIDELARHLVAGDDFHTMSDVVHRLTLEVMAGTLSLPVQVFDTADAQPAYDTGAQPDLIGRVALSFGDPARKAPTE